MHKAQKLESELSLGPNLLKEALSLSVLCPWEDWDEVEVAETSDSTISASSATLLRLREVRSARALEMEILTLSQVLLFFFLLKKMREIREML